MATKPSGVQNQTMCIAGGNPNYFLGLWFGSGLGLGFDLGLGLGVGLPKLHQQRGTFAQGHLSLEWSYLEPRHLRVRATRSTDSVGDWAAVRGIGL